jgi:phosphoesterase RecJ-like protein
MIEYSTNTTCAELAERLREARTTLVVTHARPDGDALGSVLALVRGLNAVGVDAKGLLIGPVAPHLLALIGPTPASIHDAAKPPAETDAIVMVDTGAASQVRDLAPWLAARHERVFILDHHVQGDLPSAARIVDASKASASLLVMDLCDALGVPLTGGQYGIAEAIFAGLATDTGWFRFNNADARAFAAASRLIAAGVDKTRIHSIVEENYRPQRIAVLARALSSARLLANGQGAVMVVRPPDFRAADANVEDLSGAVNEPLAVGGVRVSALVTSTDGLVTKISFRSKPGAPGAPVSQGGTVDVNQLARPYGGGGHVHAAGARLQQPIDEIVKRVEADIEALFAA